MAPMYHGGANNAFDEQYVSAFLYIFIQIKNTKQANQLIVVKMVDFTSFVSFICIANGCIEPLVGSNYGVKHHVLWLHSNTDTEYSVILLP